MNSSWQPTKLFKALAPVSRPEAVDPTKEYRLLGIRLDGGGPFLRETITGSQSAATKLSKVEAGDFIYSRLFAWRGAFGVIASPFDGCYVSGEFPTFRPIQDILDTEFLRLWFRLPSTIKQVEENCTGSTPLTRNRFKENFFLDLEIPLPPLPEQQRIVARIEALAAKIEEARELNNKKAKDLDHLLICMAHRNDLDDEKKAQKSWRKIRLEAVLTLLDDSQPVYADKSYQNLGIYSFGRGLFHKTPIDGALTSAKTLRKVKKGQFIYSRLFAFEGAYGMVTDDFDERFVSNEYPTFDCQPSHIRCEFLSAYFKSPLTWELMAVGSKGLGHRRQRVQPEQILGHEIWLPPMKWQNQIAEAQSKLSDLYKHQTGCNNELGALLPSILDKAFRGGL